MKSTSADHDDFQPGPHGLWALGLMTATRARFRHEFSADETVMELAGVDEVEVDQVDGDEAVSLAGTG